MKTRGGFAPRYTVYTDFLRLYYEMKEEGFSYITPQYERKWGIHCVKAFPILYIGYVILTQRVGKLSANLSWGQISSSNFAAR